MPVCTKPHSCPSCHKRFAAKDRLENHLRAHGSEEFKPKQCNICSKRFLNNSALGSHLRTHNGQGSLWECSICKETHCNRDGLKRHVASHSDNGSFSCPFCRKVYSGYMSIRKHITKIHKSAGVQCSLCDRFCSSAQKYEEHMLRHSDEKQYTCERCEKKFKRSDKLKEHIRRLHSWEIQNPNDTSETEDDKKNNRKKSTEKTIERKLRDLNEQYLFKCKPCLLGFKRRGMLVNHIAKYHPNIAPDEVPELNLPIMKTTRDFYCHLCEKVYKSNAKRKAHIMKFHPGAVKTGNGSFDQLAGTVAKKAEHCPWCHKQYATNAKLLQHVRSQHADKSYKELRKRGKTRAEKLHNASAEFKENRISRINASNAIDSSSEGLSIDSYESDMFDGKTTKIESCSSENSLTESDVGIQLESFLTGEKDDCKLVKNESSISESTEVLSIDSCASKIFGCKSSKIELFISETSVESEGSSIDSCESNIFDGKATKTKSGVSENSLVESEVGMQLESFLTEEDDDLTLAVCLMMSHANMSPVEGADEILAESSEISSPKANLLCEELNDTSIEDMTTLGEASLTTEDDDLFMAEWLVDVQAGPPFCQTAVPVIQTEKEFEVGQSMLDISEIPVCDLDTCSESDYQLYDLNASSGGTQLPPPQVVYSPYPPH
ncbi:zinc finger protein 665-like [Thrips palmi]|uniref:Zinc finger protein 665-like n=1 Tax=Thrips palmi TaxID=161013 RepID=A0A6P8Z3W9_THRPL|nr:zinc finger protein 665-like [Thrips palmi]